LARGHHAAARQVQDIDDLGDGDDGISHVTACVGFQDEVDVPRILNMAVAQGLEGDCDVAVIGSCEHWRGPREGVDGSLS
jgi:hypothetical protein